MTKSWIVVPNQNGLRFLPDCLRTLREHSPDAAICLVDNASTDGGLEYVREWHPDVHIVELELNLGFVQATNLGLLAGMRAGAEYFVLLNNDTLVGEGWLDGLEQAASSDPEIGVVGAWQNDFWDNPSPRTQAILRSVGLNDREPCELPPLVDIDWVEGSCFLVRRELLEQIGFLDPLFAPAYFEEVDFCRRARRAGWRVALATNAVIDHFGAGSSQTAPGRRRQRILNERNYLIYHAADPGRGPAAALATLFTKAVRRGLKAWRRREVTLGEWARAVAEVTPRVVGIAAKNARDRRNRPCPVLGDQSLSTLEQRYYADRVAAMQNA